jgi:hypothetical protein
MLSSCSIRIAQSLGLHRDGSKFGLSPFDTEIRRRLWWQVCIVDVRASEDHGSDPSIMSSSYDTKLPTNCNDSDLDPSYKELPQPREGVSEMTFCLIRFEICSLARVISYAPPGQCPLDGMIPKPSSFEEKERMIKESGMRMENTYLRHCENAGPLYWVAAIVARLVTAKMCLILYHPLIQPDKTDKLTSDTRDRLFMASIEILEYSQLLQAESTTRQWGWLFATYIQWHAIAYLLGELSIRGNSLIVERAWNAIDNCFGACGALIFNGKHGTLWRPLRKLALQARKKRDENAAMAAVNTSPLGLGIAPENLRPMPGGYPSKTLKPFLRIPGMTMREPANINSTVSEKESSTSTELPSYQTDTQMTNQTGLAPDQELIEQEMLHYYNTNANMNQVGPEFTPWFMNDTALQDLDMDALEGDVDWQDWDSLVRDFQLDQGADLVDTQRGPVLDSIGTWW